MKRFGVSLEEDLLDELDLLVQKHQLPNRSQAIRYLIRKQSVKEQWEDNKEVGGCVVVVYDHHKQDVVNKSMKIQHDYQDIILCTQHIHLDHNHCLESIMLKGKAKQLKALSEKLIALKGINHGELVMTSII